jgi:hypothetical protein
VVLFDTMDIDRCSMVDEGDGKNIADDDGKVMQEETIHELWATMPRPSCDDKSTSSQ